MLQDALYEISEAAALRIGAGEVASDESKGELLAQFIGGFGVPERAEQVAVNGPAVALKHLGLGQSNRFARAVMRPADDGPHGGDIIERLTRIVGIHGAGSGQDAAI